MVIVAFAANIPSVLSLVFREAFSLRATAGGALGMVVAMRYGLALAVDYLRRPMFEFSSMAPPDWSELGHRLEPFLGFIAVLVLWLLGLIGNVGGGLIWLLLVIAAIVLVFQVLSGRRAV